MKKKSLNKLKVFLNKGLSKEKMNFDVGIIGLGYVGLTLGTALAKCGLEVVE